MHIYEGIHIRDNLSVMFKVEAKQRETAIMNVVLVISPGRELPHQISVDVAKLAMLEPGGKLITHGYEITYHPDEREDVGEYNSRDIDVDDVDLEALNGKLKDVVGMVKNIVRGNK